MDPMFKGFRYLFLSLFLVLLGLLAKGKEKVSLAFSGNENPEKQGCFVKVCHEKGKGNLPQVVEINFTWFTLLV